MMHVWPCLVGTKRFNSLFFFRIFSNNINLKWAEYFYYTITNALAKLREIRPKAIIETKRDFQDRLLRFSSMALLIDFWPFVKLLVRRAILCKNKWRRNRSNHAKLDSVEFWEGFRNRIFSMFLAIFRWNDRERPNFLHELFSAVRIICAQFQQNRTFLGKLFSRVTFAFVFDTFSFIDFSPRSCICGHRWCMLDGFGKLATY